VTARLPVLAVVRRVLLTLLLAMPLTPALGQDELPLEALGDLELAWAPITPLERVPGPSLRATVGTDPGAAFRLLLPATVQRADFLVGPGAEVAPGDPLVILEGPEIHHWLLEFEALEQRFATARRRYEGNLPLYREGALSQDRWAEIQERYFALRLEHEHMRHFHEWLLDSPAGREEALLLGAPVAGLVIYDSGDPTLGAGQMLLEILPADGLRLRVEAPRDRAATLEALSFGDCEVPVDRVETAARNFYRAAWSAPLVGDCRLAPGTILGVRPHYRAKAMLVPREALFQWRREPHVLLRRGERLVAQQVALLADMPEGYAVVAETALEDAEVLVRSVSAAQGILLGLGGD
jgi:hypothetical protein